MDYLIKSYLFNKMVRMYAASTTNLVSKAQRISNLYPTSSAVLGRVLTFGAMFGAMYKQDESITIRLKCDGPIGNVVCEANSKGIVRGYVDNPAIFIEYISGPLKNHLNVKDAVGSGYIYITKDLSMGNMYTSSSEIISGEIAEDFTYYLALSEQTPSSVGLGVLVDTDASIKASGGFIIQIMPNCPEEIITLVEDKIKNLKPCSTMIEEGYTPLDMIKEITDDYEVLEEINCDFVCNCSKEKFKKGLLSIDIDTLKQLAFEDKKAETTCNFCNKKYNFTEDELIDIVNIKKKSLDEN